MTAPAYGPTVPSNLVPSVPIPRAREMVEPADASATMASASLCCLQSVCGGAVTCADEAGGGLTIPRSRFASLLVEPEQAEP